MTGSRIGILVALILLNGMAAFISGQGYTAWSIRVRNGAWFLLLNRQINKERMERSHEIAERVVRWLRPLVFTLVNLGWLMVAINYWND